MLMTMIRFLLHPSECYGCILVTADVIGIVRCPPHFFLIIEKMT